MGYIDMCGPKGYGFSAALVIDRVSILDNFGQFGHKWGTVFALKPYGHVFKNKSRFHHYRKENQQKSFTFMFTVSSELRN